MLETTFPTIAIARLADYRARRNRSCLTALTSGEAHREAGVRGTGSLIAGSSAEGLTLGDKWGFPWADVDGMIMYGAQLGVCSTQEHLPSKQQHPLSGSSWMLSSLSSLSARILSSLSPRRTSVSIPGRSCLVYDSDGCPPAYTRLRVTDPESLMAHPYVDIDADCMLKCDGHHWLLSTRLNEAIQRDINQLQSNPAAQSTSISGPAGQAHRGLYDIVPTLVANEPHPTMEHYINRLRSTEWPSQDQRQQVQQLPMNFVLVGHKDSPRKDQEFRFSWSAAELILICTLPDHIKQGYIAFKYVMKYFLQTNRGQNETGHGRSKIGSYHFKMTLLYHLENTSPSKIKSAFHLMMDLLNKFISYLNDGKLPHYFLPECDLLATVGHKERQLALKSINDIISDPIAAVLKCASVPSELYNDISPDDLVAAFRYVSVHPRCGRRREDLLFLLSHLDEWRKQRYRKRLERDNDREEQFRVSGRPELQGLVRGILKHIEHI